MNITFRHLDVRPPGWLPASRTRPRTPFSASYTATVKLLDRELAQLGATSAHVQVDLEAGSNGVRIDGQLRASAKVAHPGVILTVVTRSHGTLVYDCDRFGGGGSAWQANLRAIALGLEALRKIDRYGIADRGQQYAGFAALGSGDGSVDRSGASTSSGAGGPVGGVMTVEDAYRLLSELAGASFSAGTPFETIRLGFRAIARTYHPDVAVTGNASRFQSATQAFDVIKKSRRL